MLTKIEVRSARGLLLELPLFDEDGDYLVKDIEGLDPVDATLTYSSMATLDDELEQSSKRVKRNIILTLGYEPDYVTTDIKTLRDQLYLFFMPKAQVFLKFYSDDMGPVEIEGRVEKMNAPLFSKDPQAVISIICGKSNFYGLSARAIGGGTIATQDETSWTYEGTIETGGIFELKPNRTMSGFTIYNRLADDSVQSQAFVYPLLAGDLLEINSVPLSKGAYLTRGGSRQSVLFGISPYSQWFNLYPGVNRIRVSASGAAVPWTFNYADKFGGL